MSDTPQPRLSHTLFGHEAAEKTFLSALQTGRMHHAWLICGPRGIGKASFAYRAARAVLSGTGRMDLEEEHPVSRRIAAGSHTDMLVVEQPYDKEREELKQEIPVDAAREIPGFMSLTPAESDWRVVIIDSVDALTNAAANAILKTLEEPPPRALLLLVSHNPGRLLPTIRSRCRTLKLQPLAPELFRETLQNLAPEVGEAEIDILAQLSGFSPGVALELEHMGAPALYDALAVTVKEVMSGRPTVLTAFAESALVQPLHARWRMLALLLCHLIERTTQRALDEDFMALNSSEREAVDALLLRRGAQFWAAQHGLILRQFSLAARFHLDYKTVLITLLQSLDQADIALTA